MKFGTTVECLNNKVKKRFSFPGLAVLIVVLITSCYYDNKEDLYRNFPKESCDTSQTGYSAYIEPLISRECATPGCHVGPSPAGGRDLSTYTGVQAIANNGSLVGRITGTSGALMPFGGPKLPDCDIEKIKTWVNKGARNN